MFDDNQSGGFNIGLVKAKLAKLLSFLRSKTSISNWSLIISGVLCLMGVIISVAGLTEVVVEAKASDKTPQTSVVSSQTALLQPRLEDCNQKTDEKPNTIVVDVSGSVARPGVYSLTSSARVNDAMVAAGGLSQTADPIYISKELNLSSALEDQQKIYIPSKKEREVVVSCQNLLENKTQTPVDSQVTNSEGLISINTASLAQLDELPGIGTVRAQEIIGGRPYSALEDLLNMNILGESTYESVKDMISL